MKDNDIVSLLAKGNWIRERTWSLARRDTVGKLSNSEMVFIRGEKVKRYSMLILLYWRAHLFLCVHVFWVFYNRAACQYCYKKDKVTSHDVVYPAIISLDTLLIWITSLRQKLILLQKAISSKYFNHDVKKIALINVLNIFIVYDWMITYSNKDDVFSTISYTTIIKQREAIVLQIYDVDRISMFDFSGQTNTEWCINFH